MSKRAKEGEMRQKVTELLQSKGYEVRDVSAGQGVPKKSRLELTKDGTRQTCVVKTSAGGRISFTRDPAGRYPLLDEVDLVAHVQPEPDDRSIRVRLFSQETIHEAFEKNHAAMKPEGQDHLPMWLSPEREEALRFTGSGYGKDELWSETVPLDSPITADATLQESAAKEAGATGIMQQVRQILSAHMGVRPDQLEIDVRVRL